MARIIGENRVRKIILKYTVLKRDSGRYLGKKIREVLRILLENSISKKSCKLEISYIWGRK